MDLLASEEAPAANPARGAEVLPTGMSVAPVARLMLAGMRRIEREIGERLLRRGIAADALRFSWNHGLGALPAFPHSVPVELRLGRRSVSILCLRACLQGAHERVLPADLAAQIARAVEQLTSLRRM